MPRQRRRLVTWPHYMYLRFQRYQSPSQKLHGSDRAAQTQTTSWDSELTFNENERLYKSHLECHLTVSLRQTALRPTPIALYAHCGRLCLARSATRRALVPSSPRQQNHYRPHSCRGGHLWPRENTYGRLPLGEAGSRYFSAGVNDDLLTLRACNSRWSSAIGCAMSAAALVCWGRHWATCWSAGRRRWAAAASVLGCCRWVAVQRHVCVTVGRRLRSPAESAGS